MLHGVAKGTSGRYLQCWDCSKSWYMAQLRAHLFVASLKLTWTGFEAPTQRIVVVVVVVVLKGGLLHFHVNLKECIHYIALKNCPHPLEA